MSEQRETDWRGLIGRALARDDAAVNELVELSHPGLFRYCFFLSKNRQLAEDLTHDALLKALSSLAMLKQPEAFIGWLKRIARSLYLDYVKSAAQSKRHMPTEDAEMLGFLQDDPATALDRLATLEALQKLSEEDRSILVLVDIQECSYAETAEILQVPEGTVKSRLSRARVKFSEVYDGTKAVAGSSQPGETRREANRPQRGSRSEN